MPDTPIRTAVLEADPTEGSGPDGGTDTELDHIVDEDLLVEEVSIDGMCGVY
ncbi:mycofactocin precursor [Saccharomonospora sp. CUA-673]|uniref:mycofactocin precursor MftA n=1 Tax=Saccharomonospora sp. CUA-673 TaxID=1904969 RepID=UPI00095B7441|nr:mycofactocin precursor MftA [Saccharomonospora sp. CUA-673]OLT44590.1 mycofactocin precursor [Saccharomonospora sp. CUA-673]